MLLNPDPGNEPNDDEWRGRPEGGTRFGLRAMVWIARRLGRPVLKLALYPIALYFVLFRHAERAASAAYLERIFGRPPVLREIFRHFVTFATVTADRIYFLTGQTESLDITVNQVAEMKALVDQGRGGIVLAAHIGSFEAARVLGTTLGDVHLRVVLDRTIAKHLSSELDALDAGMSELIIDANQPAAMIGLQIAESLARADWVGFLADRYRTGDRTVVCKFLGGNVRLPLGPLIIASISKVPLVCIFPLYIEGKYEIHCEILSDSFFLARADREAALQEYAQQFADKMSEYLHRAPYNWFNFYDYWGEDA